MKILYVILIVTLAASAQADSKVVGHQKPLPNETLSQPLALSGMCSNILVKEWRGTKPSVDKIKVMSMVCNMVVDRFYSFVKEQGFSATKRYNPRYSLSLIPWYSYSGGNEYRNLNDSSYRFVSRPKFCNDEGRTCKANETPWPLQGYTDRVDKFIYMRNDPIVYGKENKEFKTLFAHELFHMMSFETRSFHKHSSPKIEELLANKFTIALGLGRI